VSIRASIQVDEHEAELEVAHAFAPGLSRRELEQQILSRAPRTVSWARLALVAALFAIVVTGLILAAGCSTLPAQGLAVSREGRALSDGWALEAPSDAAGVAATRKLDSDEDALEAANGTTGYQAWFATFAAAAPAPTP